MQCCLEMGFGWSRIGQLLSFLMNNLHPVCRFASAQRHKSVTVTEGLHWGKPLLCQFEVLVPVLDEDGIRLSAAFIGCCVA